MTQTLPKAATLEQMILKYLVSRPQRKATVKELQSLADFDVKHILQCMVEWNGVKFVNRKRAVVATDGVEFAYRWGKKKKR